MICLLFLSLLPQYYLSLATFFFFLFFFFLNFFFREGWGRCTVTYVMLHCEGVSKEFILSQAIGYTTERSKRHTPPPPSPPPCPYHTNPFSAKAEPHLKITRSLPPSIHALLFSGLPEPRMWLARFPLELVSLEPLGAQCRYKGPCGYTRRFLLAGGWHMSATSGEEEQARLGQGSSIGRLAGGGERFGATDISNYNNQTKQPRNLSLLCAF